MTSPLPAARPRTCLVAGIDPGAHSGLVALEIPTRPMPFDQLEAHIQWRGACQLNPITRKAMRPEQLSILVFERLRDRLQRWGVVDVAIEEPSDAMDKWSQGGVGVSFALGRAYERALLAATYAGCRVFPYQVREWMPKATTRNKRGGMTTHTQASDETANQMDVWSRQLRRPAQEGEGPYALSVARAALDRLSKDELMALGVLRYHLARQAPLPLAPSVDALPPRGLARR
jgi:hypothetical protein